MAKVTVIPEEFTFVKYDAAEIAGIVADLAERLGVANPIRVVVDETSEGEVVLGFRVEGLEPLGDPRTVGISQVVGGPGGGQGL